MLSSAVLVAIVSSQAAEAPLAHFRPTDLRCEGDAAPLAATAAPYFTWRIEGSEPGLTQSAWQVLVASDASLLQPELADLWDSGRLVSPRGPGAVYAGSELVAGQAYAWCVRSWDRDGAVTPWSAPATFEVAPLGPLDWQGAKWIEGAGAVASSGAEAYDQPPAPLLRHEFEITQPVLKARLHLAGLGVCLPSLNGEPVGDSPLDPTWTAFSKRVLFRTYDVTERLELGANCLGVELGNGWYQPLPLRMWGRLNLTEHLDTGAPCALAMLEISHPDGTSTTVTTGPDWRTAPGPTLFNNLYLGEVRDERLRPARWSEPSFNDEEWAPVRLGAASLESLRPLLMPPVRAAETVPATAVRRLDADTLIVDFGRNLTGVPELDLDVEAGTRLTFRYGELLHEDGTLNPMTSVCGQIKGMRAGPDGKPVPKGGPGAPEIAWQQDVYTTRGGGEIYRPRFTFHGFRYMEVKGAVGELQPGDCRALLLRTDLASAGSFSSSSDLLNGIQAMCRRTFLANVVGVQSDCPHRERFAYGGDIVATSDAFMMNFDMSQFYAKTVRDWADSARPDGMLTDTAPFVGIQYCGVGWSMVHPQLLEQLDRHYGVQALLDEQFPVALRWLEAEAARRKDGLVVTGLGDHEGLQRVGGPVLTTSMFVYAARCVERLARRLRNEEAAARCEALAQESTAAWRKAFGAQAGEGVVGTGTQSEMIFALGFNMLSEAHQTAVFEALVQALSTEDGPRLQTGIFGTQLLMEELSRRGRSDLALALATRETFPSWGWMLANDATTLWEHWEGSDNTYSNNHPMFGSISNWFYRWLGGIQPDEDAVGFNKVVIRPQVLAGLEHIESSHRTVHGLIESNWRRIPGGVRFSVAIPPDTAAILQLELGSESRRVEVGSGRFEFELKEQER